MTRLSLAIRRLGRGTIGDGIDSSTGERASAPAIPVEVADPAGAGGVFDAAFVTLVRLSLAQRIRFANLCIGLSGRHRSGSLGRPAGARSRSVW
jgi:sugar/nucleoside kinase (ribokinase family)